MGCFVNFGVFAYEWNTDVVQKSHDKTQREEIKEKAEKKKKHLGAL